MRRRRKHRAADGVELNLAAMLDMAFQLLAFFILTFQPGKTESQFLMNLPVSSAAALPQAVKPPPGDAVADVATIRSLDIKIASRPDGSVKELLVGQNRVFTGAATPENLEKFRQRLEALCALQDEPFEKVSIDCSQVLRYEELMKVVDITANQRMAGGAPLANVSIGELQE